MHNGKYGVGPSHQLGSPLSHVSISPLRGQIRYHIQTILDVFWISAIRMARPAIPGNLCTMFKVTGTGQELSHMFVLSEVLD